LTRRAALQTAEGGLAAAALSRLLARTPSARAQEATPEAAAMPVTGEAVPALAGFDEVMTTQIAKWHLPGGQLAVARGGKLVLNRGYGLADVENKVPVQPDSLIRIASVTKTITAVAVLALVDDGLLRLDDRVFPLLDLEPAPNATIDPRLDEITVEQLLVHAGGWDSLTSFDPQYLPWSRMAAATVGQADPPIGEAIIRGMLGVPLDFDPGTKQVYSNFGFNVLGRVIEHASGQPYEEYVRERVLLPAGVTDMRLGRTRREERAPGEVFYYGPLGQAWRESVFWGEGYVPVGYGSYYMEALDAHGGWIASAADLVRFATAVDGQHGQPLLTPETIELMETTPRPPSGGTGAGNVATGHGLGWDVKAVDGGYEWMHAGALEGSCSSWLYRGPDGMVLAFIFNSLPVDYLTFFPGVGDGLLAAARAVEDWPEGEPFVAAGESA
jgi:N-acyl-D-amino-acid deacylase